MVQRHLIRLLSSTALASGLSCSAQACPTFHTLTNGTTADASQVMDNFNVILQCPNFTGNVGIGISIPSYTLDIGGSAQVRGPAGTNPAKLFLNPSGAGYVSEIRSEASGDQTLKFIHNGNSALAINSSGNVGIGTATPSRKLEVNGEVKFGGSDWGNLYGYTNAGVLAYAMAASTGNTFFNGGGNFGIGTTTPSYALHVSGTAYATGAAGALSDIRHKKDIASLKDGALDFIMKLRPVSFKWKNPKDDGMKGNQIGFIAQEVEKILPTIVLTQNNEERTKGLKYNELIPVITKALQELEALNEQQGRGIAALKAENASLREEFSARISRLERKALTRANYADATR